MSNIDSFKLRNCEDEFFDKIYLSFWLLVWLNKQFK